MPAPGAIAGCSAHGANSSAPTFALRPGRASQWCCADLVNFAERDPWGIKDVRLRALLERAIASSDSSMAGIAALPGSLMLELRWLVQHMKDGLARVRQPRAQRAPARRRSGKLAQ